MAAVLSAAETAARSLKEWFKESPPPESARLVGTVNEE